MVILHAPSQHGLMQRIHDDTSVSKWLTRLHDHDRGKSVQSTMISKVFALRNKAFLSFTIKMNESSKQQKLTNDEMQIVF